MKESPYLEGRLDLLDSMKKMQAFAPLGDRQLATILSLSKIRTYSKGEPIITQGSFESWIYFIISGSVRVERDGRKIGELQGSGAVFGEMGIIDGTERSASVVAHSDVMVLCVDASFLDRMEDVDRASCYTLFYKLFATILAERLRQTSDELAQAKEKMAVLRRRIVDSP
ncbi:CRP-like cAMP-binding protein [Desulfobaculum xiamenense]|uniref:CRP-like cAMP-binding protein n=1 Tax=Desulfobaculum xiamenense TaxID=995050 RepID=A0A846QR29_9BACT|nr:cyclic nucleotide-binding domain-containing protein [Desulfobaculum xiamenense]NJB68932.1 CRP-like cAMP-binding protein [Desulfobaculum xiamenense]